jgi:prepilin-type N-terminal cleavage/methylation domain-containing protein
MRKFYGTRGVTLVEVLVSVLVVSIVLSVVLVVVSQSVVNTQVVDMVYTASNLARQRVDSIKRLPFSDLKRAGEETDTRIDEYGVADASGDYSRTTVITESHLGNPYLTEVSVSVDRYVDGALSGNPVVIDTLIADIE